MLQQCPCHGLPVTRCVPSLQDGGTMSKNPNASNPSAFLKNVLGRPVVVKLNSGVDYRGAWQ